jgi:hypothetical protein
LGNATSITIVSVVVMVIKEAKVSNVAVAFSGIYLTFPSLNTTTTKETIIIYVALPKEGKRINVEVNVVGFSNVLISVYRCKNA